MKFPMMKASAIAASFTALAGLVFGCGAPKGDMMDKPHDPTETTAQPPESDGSTEEIKKAVDEVKQGSGPSQTPPTFQILKDPRDKDSDQAPPPAQDTPEAP